jgi:hypothetical protein
MRKHLWVQPLVISLGVLAAVGLSGCATGVEKTTTGIVATPSAPATIQVAPLKGLVMGGQQPVGNVSLQLYQAGMTGYGSLATALGTSFLTTQGGNFTTPSYTCTAGSQVYLVGTGGQPGGQTNNNLAMMVGLGTCGGTDLNSFINVNELTTVASVWALSPFMKGTKNIGTSSSNLAGLTDAFAAINELVNTTNGAVPGPALPAGASFQQATINTLAEILLQCVNSGGGAAPNGVSDGSNCGNLFALAPNAAGTVYPTDTITAAMNIAQSPGRNVTAINNIRMGTPQFTPVFNLGKPPNDWTIAITYTGGGLSAPTSIAADAAGAVWITNNGNSSVTKLDDTGTAISGTNGFTAGGSINSPSAVAIDGNGNAWIANAGNNTVTELNSVGASVGVVSDPSLKTPASLAIDGSGNVWIANSGSNSVTAFTSSGVLLSGAPFTSAATSTPGSVAVTPK